MTNIETIRQEIERRKEELERDKYINIDAKTCRQSELKYLERFINSLPEEFPPYCTGFKGDPDPAGTSDLEEAAEKYELENRQSILSSVDIVDAFIAGAEWQESQAPLPEDSVAFNNGVKEGKRLLMEEAIEGEIGYWNQRGLSIRLDKSLERLGYDMDTKVKIVIVKE